MAAISLQTKIPGPRSVELARRRTEAVPRGVSQTTPIFVKSAHGAVIEDVDGNRFIDLAGGIGCVNSGHRAPSVQAAIEEQAGKFLHTCFMVTPYESYIRLAERLNAMTPGNFAKKTILLNSGAEAVENAVKIARAYTKRPAVLCFEDAFHGRTLLSLSLTSKTSPYKTGFHPFVSDIYRVPYGYCYRCSYNLTYPECGVHCAHILEETFKKVVAAESVAAILVEPILGEGGFVAPPKEFFGVLQEIARKYGILLIADEVQTGFARTGRMFACEHFDLEPDLILTAKSLGGGLPLAAVTGRAEIMDNTGPGSLGGTFGGNPLACEAALAGINTIESEDLCGRAIRLGELFRKRALGWKRTFDVIGDVRGLGAMQAMELVERNSRTPATEATKQMVKFCYEHGVLLVTAGTYGNVIRLLAPLVISEAELEEAFAVLEQSLAEVAQGLSLQLV